MSRSKEEILDDLADKLDMDVASFLEVVRDTKADGKIGDKSADVFIDSFLVELERMSNIIDEMEVVK